MSISDLKYRTKTYIAGDWTGDNNAVSKLMTWNEGDKWSLHFQDVHQLTQSYDSSLYCSIKHSLNLRMRVSKLFILVVGNSTNTVTKGACFNCSEYERFLTMPPNCKRGNRIDNRSYVKYECSLARAAFDRGQMSILVLYNSAIIDRSKCPEAVRDVGVHIAMKSSNPATGIYDYDYKRIKNAIERLL